MAPLNVWNAWEQVKGAAGTSPKNELIVLVSLIRVASGIDERLTPYDKTVNKNFQDWVIWQTGRKTEIQRRTDELAANDQGSHRHLGELQQGGPGLCPFRCQRRGREDVSVIRGRDGQHY